MANEKLYNEVLGILKDEVFDIINELTLDIFVCSDQGFVSSIVSSIEKYQTPNCILQVVPKNLVVSKAHIKLAAYLTFKAFKKNRNISRKKYMELLLYLFSERQIGKVIEKINRFGRPPYLVVLVCKDTVDAITGILRRSNLELERCCNRLESREGKDPLEADVDINIVKAVFGMQETDDIIKAVLCKVSSLVLQA